MDKNKILKEGTLGAKKIFVGAAKGAAFSAMWIAEGAETIGSKAANFLAVIIANHGWMNVYVRSPPQSWKRSDPSPSSAVPSVEEGWVMVNQGGVPPPPPPPPPSSLALLPPLPPRPRPRPRPRPPPRPVVASSLALRPRAPPAAGPAPRLPFDASSLVARMKEMKAPKAPKEMKEPKEMKAPKEKAPVDFHEALKVALLPYKNLHDPSDSLSSSNSSEW